LTRAPRLENGLHPLRRFTLTALNARFAQHSGRSRRHHRTAEVDPFETFMTAPPGEPSHRKADDQSQ
jgi:hypothetical protein